MTRSRLSLLYFFLEKLYQPENPKMSSHLWYPSSVNRFVGVRHMCLVSIFGQTRSYCFNSARSRAWYPSSEGNFEPIGIHLNWYTYCLHWYLLVSIRLSKLQSPHRFGNHLHLLYLRLLGYNLVSIFTASSLLFGIL